MSKYKRFNIWNVMNLLENSQTTGDPESMTFRRANGTFETVTVEYDVMDDKFSLTKGGVNLGILKTKGAVWDRLK